MRGFGGPTPNLPLLIICKSAFPSLKNSFKRSLKNSFIILLRPRKARYTYAPSVDFDKSVTKIDNLVTKIDKSVTKIDKSVTKIDKFVKIVDKSLETL